MAKTKTEIEVSKEKNAKESIYIDGVETQELDKTKKIIIKKKGENKEGTTLLTAVKSTAEKKKSDIEIKKIAEVKTENEIDIKKKKAIKTQRDINLSRRTNKKRSSISIEIPGGR